MSATSTAPLRSPELLRSVQSLYDQHRYQDAFAEVRPLFHPEAALSSFTAEELVLAGRLAVRLGGGRLSRWLLRAARKLAPDNPKVMYFSSHLERSHLIHHLRDFETVSNLKQADVETQANWLGSHAYLLASLRDFENAELYLRRAFELRPDDSWIRCCEAEVRKFADRWDEALQSAERAFAHDPASPFVLETLATALLNLGRVEEACHRLEEAAKTTQAPKVVQLAHWYCCALAETLQGEERRHKLQEASEFAARARTLSPLADRDFDTYEAHLYLDIAELSDDHAAMEHWAERAKSPFYRQVVANLKRHPQGRRLRLPYPRLLQKHLACVPTSVQSAMAANGVRLSADQMEAEVSFGGTYEWAAADWLRERGYHVRFFSVTPEVATALIENRIAFVLSWDADESGHAVAAVGVDEAAGTLIVHDPQSFRSTEYLLSHLADKHGPLGVKGMAAVASERAAELDALLPAESAIREAVENHQRAMMLQGPSAAAAVVTALEQAFPQHPGTRYLRAVQYTEEGKSGAALACLAELFREFPESVVVRVKYLDACRETGNSARQRATLLSIIEGGAAPGMESRQDWVRPPIRYEVEYADILRLSATTRPEAKSRLLRVLRRAPYSASGWHNLGDLFWSEGDLPSSLLCYRLAATQATDNEHYASAYGDALARLGRQEEGFRWLEQRCREYGSSARAARTWVTWISLLEDWGQPERALEACASALAAHPEAPELLSFAAAFYGRMGDWERADQQLSALEKCGNPASFHQASFAYWRMRGEPQRSLEHARAWHRETPLAAPARKAVLDSLARIQSPEAVLAQAAEWRKERPEDEAVEESYYQQLDGAFAPRRQKYFLLRRRVRRNPEDAWAWRELTFLALSDYESASQALRPRFARRIQSFLAQCDRTSPEEVATIRAHALWLEDQGQWVAAVDQSLRAIELAPDGFYSYRRLWDGCARLSEPSRQEIWSKAEAHLLGSPGRLYCARDVMALITYRYGVQKAQEVLARWQASRPSDPNVLEACADLLLEHGHGRSDAQRALELVEPEVPHYPYHLGLRLSLAHAWRGLGEHEKAEQTLVELARRHPENTYVRTQLAWIAHNRNDFAAALEHLDRAATADPSDVSVWRHKLRILMERREIAAVLEAVQQGLRDWPQHVGRREDVIYYLNQIGLHEKAMAAAREGVEVYPTGAYMWFILAQALCNQPALAQPGEIEHCLRKSLALNAGLLDAADLLATVLTDQRRYEEARAVLHDIEKRQCDPSAVRGRLAWIRRVAGEKRPAVEDMVATLQDYPWYRWGWERLLEWLHEDRDWERAVELLRTVPAALYADTGFRYRRLDVLTKAKLAVAVLDEEWTTLLQDFPEDESLFVVRYDLLEEAQRFAEADAVLDRALAFRPQSNFVRARLVSRLLRQQQKEEAIQQVLAIMFAPIEESVWPVNHTWELAQRVRMERELFDAALRRIEEGGKPTGTAFRCLVNYAVESLKGTHSTFPELHRWFPPRPVKEALKMLEKVDRPEWRDEGYRGIAYRALNDVGQSHAVVRRAGKPLDPASMEAGEWAEVARALIDTGRRSKAREFLADWEQQPGVGMWMVTNYLLCLKRRAHRRKIIETCQSALQKLPHDTCACYLAHRAVEAAALFGDRAAVVAIHDSYAGYFARPLNSDEYFHAQDRHLMDELPELVSEAKEQRWASYNWRLLQLRWKRLLDADTSDIAPWWFWVAGLLALRACASLT